MRIVSERIAHAHIRFGQLDGIKDEPQREDNIYDGVYGNTEDDVINENNPQNEITNSNETSKKKPPLTAPKPRKSSLKNQNSTDKVPQNQESLNESLDDESIMATALELKRSTTKRPLIRGASVKDRLPIYEGHIKVNGVASKKNSPTKIYIRQETDDKGKDPHNECNSNTTYPTISLRLSPLPTNDTKDDKINSNEEVDGLFINEDEITAVEVVPDKSLPDHYDEDFFDLDESFSLNEVAPNTGEQTQTSISNAKESGFLNANSYYVASLSSSFESNDSRDSRISITKNMPIKLPKSSLDNIKLAKRRFSEHASLEAPTSHQNDVNNNNLNVSTEDPNCIVVLEGHDIEMNEKKISRQDKLFDDDSPDHVANMSELKDSINDVNLKKVVIYIEKGYLTIESVETNSTIPNLPNSKISLICKGYRIDSFDGGKDFESSSVISEQFQNDLQSVPNDYELIGEEVMNNLYINNQNNNSVDSKEDFEKIKFNMRNHSTSLRQSEIKTNDKDYDDNDDAFRSPLESTGTDGVKLRRKSSSYNDVRESDESKAKAKKRLSGVYIQAIVDKFSS